MFDKAFNILLTTASVGGVALAGFLAVLYFFQNSMLYMPKPPGHTQHPSENPTGYRSPKEYQLRYEDVEVITKDGISLRGWFIKHQTPSDHPTVVYFHENAGNIGTRIPFIKSIHERANANVLLLAYRGYSDSQGTPSEAGLQHDAIATIDYIFSRDDIDKAKVFIFGRSLGGAVSIYGLSQTSYKVAGVILENTFTSIGDMVDIIFPKLSRFKMLLLRNFWPSAERIQTLKHPMFFIMGLKDELIPTEHMLKLYQNAHSAKYKDKLQYEVPDGGHNDTWIRDVDEYFERVNSFIKKALSIQP